MASPLDYQPARHQKADEDNKYYGLLRKITFEHNGISQTEGCYLVTSYWAVVIYSCGKARLDTQYRQKALEKLLEKLDKIKKCRLCLHLETQYPTLQESKLRSLSDREGEKR